ncbi:MAG: FAD-binding oxidoreductase, partial [Bradymonadaceae bacterium]
MPDGRIQPLEGWPPPEPEPEEVAPADRQMVRRMESLCEHLEATIRGEVRLDSGSQAIYSTDGSNYRYVPLGVVLPKDTADIVETVNQARRADIPIVHRGAGTGLAGQTTNAAL